MRAAPKSRAPFVALTPASPAHAHAAVFGQASGEVVGVAFAGRSDAEGHGYIIPVPVVEAFLRVYETSQPRYFGCLPMLGISSQELVNPSLRRHSFGGTLPQHRDGILITEVGSTGCAGAAGVQRGDVLLAIDGVPVSEKGDVPFRGHERLDWTFLITSSGKTVGDEVDLELLRRSAAASMERVHVTARLTPLTTLLPSLLGVDYTPGWVIVGGLVFLRAGQPLLDQIVARGSPGDFHHVHALMRLFQEDTLGRQVQEVLILQDVLAHDINIGYESYRGLLLHSVNGTRIQSLKHLADAVDQEHSTYLVFSFWGDGGRETQTEMAVLELSACRSTATGILEQHKIPAWCSPDVLVERGAEVGPSTAPVSSISDTKEPLKLSVRRPSSASSEGALTGRATHPQASPAAAPPASSLGRLQRYLAGRRRSQ